MSSWITAHETIKVIKNNKLNYKIKNSGCYLCFSGGGGGGAWIKLFNQSSSNTNVSACKTLNLIINKH